jgi:Mg-chelatase subunit ChlD
MKKLMLLFLFAFFSIFLHAQDLTINSEDLLLEMRADGGFHLFIRKKPDIASVLLTETTRDPAMEADNYAYRAGEWNPVNGDEIRILNGNPIPQESRIYSLVSSTVVNHPALGLSFHIYLPYILYYGYEGGRYGEVFLADGTYLNIRSFVLPYADYRGDFKDNPFMLEARQTPQPRDTQTYIKEAEDAFSQIAVSTGGELIYSTSTDDVPDIIRRALEKEKDRSIDIVICLDTTNSMRRYIDPVRKNLTILLEELLSEFPSFRIGMVLYKDYYEEYLTRVIAFTSDFTQFQRTLNAIRVGGGGDVPEAVYEALYAGVMQFNWEKESRVMFLIGDAPPHPKPRGKITKEMYEDAARERNIKVHAILLPL